MAPSNWLTSITRSSKLTAGFAVDHIPYGIDTTQFRSTSQEWARGYLGIATNQFTLLFVSHAIDNRIKGFEDVLEVFYQLRAVHLQIQLIVVGRGKIELQNQDGICFLGPVQDDRLMPLIYAAADVLIFPTYADNLPNTILEAMACEIPVVAYQTGGVPEMVKDGENGFTVDKGDIKSLNATLNILIEMNPKDRKILGQQGRDRVINEFNPQLESSKYINIYSYLIKNS